MKNKAIMIIVIALSAVILLSALSAALVFALAPSSSSDDVQTAPGISFDPSDAAAELVNVDYDDESGILYVNDEILVYSKVGADTGDIKTIASYVGATCDNSMADIGLYRFSFDRKMTMSEIEDVIERIKMNPCIEDALINPLIVQEGDELLTTGTDNDGDDFEKKPMRLPDDPWNSNSWSTDVPRGENWGMEAIRAPQAWGYLNEMSSVRIGLIDSLPNVDHPDGELQFEKMTNIFIDDTTGEISYNRYTVFPDEHGTHVSGIMNAQWNGAGVNGVTDGHASIYYAAVRTVSDGVIKERYATSYTYLLALKTLLDDDVQVINISQNTSRLTGFAASRGNEKAINYLTSQAKSIEKGLSRIISERNAESKPDFVICVAAGNNNRIYYVKDKSHEYGYRAATDSEIRSGKGLEFGGAEAKYNNFLNLVDEKSVKDRIIVVGAVGIDKEKSTSVGTVYSYAYFSNIGDRVDVVAPGVDIYSTYYDPDKPYLNYEFLSGTSMATPHTAGVAGLIFACNPDLSGADVKSIIVSTASGRYYYKDGYSGLLNAEDAVIAALKTRESSVKKVLKTAANGLDLCFVVDTTGSMGDDIENAQRNMRDILNRLASKTQDYRVAIVDYRDFSSRTGYMIDYPSKVHLDFSSDNEQIIEAINTLELGSGGDEAETVYSGLMEAISLNWRSDAKKVIILLGDAEPLDPEPNTGYTYNDVILSLYNAQITYDAEHSDERVLPSPTGSLINVYSIGAEASDDAEDFFSDVAEYTGGMYSDTSDASQVSDAISDSIEHIEIVPTNSVRLVFDDCYSEKNIDLYSDGGEYLFSFTTNSDAQFDLENMELNDYTWKCTDLYSSGEFSVSSSKKVSAEATEVHWFTFIQKNWSENKAFFIIRWSAAAALMIAAPIVLSVVCKKVRKKRSGASVRR